MKDMYSMSVDSAQHDAYYNSVIEAYKKVYDRVGIGEDTYVTYASGAHLPNLVMNFKQFAKPVRILFISIVAKISLSMKKFSTMTVSQSLY